MPWAQIADGYFPALYCYIRQAFSLLTPYMYELCVLERMIHTLSMQIVQESRTDSSVALATLNRSSDQSRETQLRPVGELA